ncbi:hypothetical protein Terro_1491 [Terriglobus roseus DSM 18391]|uniref:Uncharacterized protein n=1 Tax=Terriglobus roseus (strain DSM 18391 / NRRL B-41598 / KBS 63) TaxID=926566 RepID=I3ZEY0_TERRK|nr:hypothetical protein [Terriglobus roseus]AFL87798.1 hypothetical protein Terro_1491 [Terriglobus roseus DSM 18391]
MSVVEDNRKLLQDLVAPELRAIDVRLTALEKRFDDVDRRLTAADKTEQDRFAQAEKIAAERHERILSELKSLHNEHDLEVRLVKIEAMMGLIKTEKPTSEAA